MQNTEYNAVLLCKIQHEINVWDPMGLLKIGCPTDEYTYEAHEIYKDLSHGENINQIVYNVFKKSFEESFTDRFRFEDCRDITKRLVNIFNGYYKRIGA